MRIVITGSSGLIGSALCQALVRDGHEVIKVRHGEVVSADPNHLVWNPELSLINLDRVEPFDAFVNLAGESVGSGRWNSDTKRKIYDSRMGGVKAIVESFKKMQKPPAVLINGSAVGYYGDTDDNRVDESSPVGSGFLAEVCAANEGGASKAAEFGTRVVNLRTGVVLSTKGGALAKQLPLFKLGVGGKLATGKQYLSWIHIQDEVDAIRFLLSSDLSGPVNLTSPNPVTNATFTSTLGHALNRPTVIQVPKFALSLALGGEMAKEMLMAGQRVIPTSLTTGGFDFQFPDLEGALKNLIQSGR